MRSYFSLICGISCTLFALHSYAITVTAQSPSNEVAAIGFIANGQKHGGAGRSYSKSNLPAGTYTFGVRVGGLFGKDITCFKNGQMSVQLKNDASAILLYNGGRCTLHIAGKR